MLLLAFSGHVMGQTVTGKVIDPSGIPLVGANVVEQGTTYGAVTDFDGNFSLELSSSDVVLQISYIGYETKLIPYTGQKELKVVLPNAMALLDDIVVIGYGTQKKKDVTGAMKTIKAEGIEGQPVSNMASAMQGQVAGLQVTSSSGQPGAGHNVRIRGTSSITGGSNPLYVIDNVIVTNGSALATLNTSDIESINVLKDASAPAIYGARAANGVIIITTKRGKAGKTAVNFHTYAGVQTPSKKLDMLDAQGYQTVWNAAQDNAELERFANLDGTTLTESTDWQSALLNDARIQNYELSTTSGTENTNISSSVNHYQEDGMILNTGFTRTSVRLNADTHFNNLKLGNSFYYSHSNFRDQNVVNGRGMLNWALSQSPAVAIRNENNVGGFNGPQPGDGALNKVNPIAAQELIENTRRINRFLGNVYAQYEFFDGFSYKLSLGADMAGTFNRYFAPEFDLGNGQTPLSIQNGKQVTERRTDQSSILLENMLNFKRMIGKHDVAVLLGHSAIANETSYQHTSVVGENISEAFPVINASESVSDLQGGRSQRRMLSYFGRASYGYDGKYLAMFNYRRDGSSAFTAENAFEDFMSASLGWVISEESFLEDGFFDLLKLRGSYGYLGNDQINASATQSVVNLNSKTIFNGNVLVNGVSPGSQVANRDLVWEKQEQLNLGLDMAILRNRLSLTVDYFVKNSKDLLLRFNLPKATGVGAVYLNAGQVQNKGWEFDLSYGDKKGDFSYNISANATLLNNEVKELAYGLEAIERYGNSYFVPRNRIEVGNSLFALYGYQADGIYKSEEELNDGPTPLPGTAVGDIKYKDISGPEGVPDGMITNDDRTFIGDGNQDIIYGFSMSAKYKGFDCSLQLQGVYGNEVFNETKFYTQGYYNTYNMTTDVLDAWSETNPNSDTPRAIPSNLSNNDEVSSYWVEDASYLRLRNVQLGYTIPAKAVGVIGLSSCRLYTSAQNLFTITDFSGYDPESATFSGVQGAQLYPTPKTFVLGAQIGF
ncbi:TonB-dependent receptor [Algivirga pacifica]